jgi:hypothetical protein
LPNEANASDRAASSSWHKTVASPVSSQRRMPRPPPPALLLIISGAPMRCACCTSVSLSCAAPL